MAQQHQETHIVPRSRFAKNDPQAQNDSLVGLKQAKPLDLERASTV